MCQKVHICVNMQNSSRRKKIHFFIKTKRILLYLLDLLHSIDTLIEYNCGIGMFYTFAHKCPPFHMSLADKRLAVSM